MRAHIVPNYLAIVHGICDDLSEFQWNMEKEENSQIKRISQGKQEGKRRN